MKELDIPLLVAKSISGTLTIEEKEQLEHWLHLSENNRALFKRLKEQDGLLERMELRERLDVPKAGEFVWYNYRKSLYKRYVTTGLKYAAVLVLIIGLSYFLLPVKISDEQSGVNVLRSNEVMLQKGNDADEILTIDEREVNNVSDPHGNVVGVHRGKVLQYSSDMALDKLIYHEITVPYGKTFELILSDKTHVYLNAGTTLKYPVKFIEGKTREVILKGEAYFDVTKKEKQAFVVKANDLNIKVLGTQFNVSSYPEDPDVSTVLVEGSVGLFKEGELEYDQANPILLEPGYMALSSRGKDQIDLQKVDTELYTSWKEGRLIYSELTFKDILRKLERRFDVTIINNYQALDTMQFTASFKEEKVHQILEIFSLYHNFEYEVTGNK